MNTPKWLIGAVLTAMATSTLVPSNGYAECDDKARELQQQLEQAQISSANDSAILNMYRKHNSDTTAIMGYGLAPTGDPNSREGVSRKQENDRAYRDRLQQNQQTFDRRQGEIERQYQQGPSTLGDPCNEEGSASSSTVKGKFPSSLPGLYATLLPDGNKKANYIYLFPGGNFFHWLPNEGFDGFDFARIQRDQLWGSFTGRYIVRDEKVVLRYAPGGDQGDVEITVHEAGFFPNRSGKDYVQLPVVDGMALSGTYQLVDDQLPIFFSPSPVAPPQASITFMPDGRFTDGGILSLASQLVFLTNANTVFKPRPGSGTYSLKNHTLMLRYADGRTGRFNFHVRSNSRGEPNTDKLFITGFRFTRVGELPLARLPKIQAPPGWKSQRDGSGKKSTYFVPPNLPQGRTLAVAVSDPQSLPNPDVSRFPGRFHDAGVQGAVKNLTADGYLTETAMTRDVEGKILSSSGVFGQSDGKRLWMTAFTLISSTQSQFVLFVSDSEELYKAHLPTVRAMFGDVESSPPARTTALAPRAVIKQELPNEVYLLAGKQVNAFVVFFDDGTFYPGFPYEGLDRIDRKRLMQQTPAEKRGTYTRGDNKLTMLLGNETEVFTPISYGWKGEEEDKLIKFLPVDDVRLNGTFAPVLDSAPSGNPSITLTKEGGFVDRGIFLLKELTSALEAGQSSPAIREGKGRYVIRNYTLILSYENGVEKRIGFLRVPLDNAQARVTPFFLYNVPFRRQE